MGKKIITLISDFGYNDHYAAVIKGTILSKCPDANIVDISHGISPHDSNRNKEAAFLLANSYNFFPKNTIHIICVNSETSENSGHLLVKTEGQYFICSNNSILSTIFSDKDVEVYKINFPKPTFCTFSSKDIFAEIAILIALDEDYFQYLEKMDGFDGMYLSQKPFVSNNILNGKVSFVDNNFNLITNISKEVFYDFVKDHSFEVLVSSRRYKVTKISQRYTDVIKAEIVALFGSHGYLEIALHDAKASELLGLKIDSEILVQLR